MVSGFWYLRDTNAGGSSSLKTNKQKQIKWLLKMYNVYQCYKHEKENESGQRYFKNEASCVIRNIMSYHVSAALLDLINFGTEGGEPRQLSSRAFSQEPVSALEADGFLLSFHQNLSSNYPFSILLKVCYYSPNLFNKYSLNTYSVPASLLVSGDTEASLLFLTSRVMQSSPARSMINN